MCVIFVMSSIQTYSIMKQLSTVSFERAFSTLNEHMDSTIDDPIMEGKFRGVEFLIYLEGQSLKVEDLGIDTGDGWVEYVLTDEMEKGFRNELLKLSKELENEKIKDENNEYENIDLYTKFGAPMSYSY